MGRGDQLFTILKLQLSNYYHNRKESMRTRHGTLKAGNAGFVVYVYGLTLAESECTNMAKVLIKKMLAGSEESMR